MTESSRPPGAGADPSGGRALPHAALRDLHAQLIGSAYLYDDPQAFASGVHSALVAITPLITELVGRAGGHPAHH